MLDRDYSEMVKQLRNHSWKPRGRARKRGQEGQESWKQLGGGSP